MYFTLILKNQKKLFKETFDEQYKIFQIIARTGLFSHLKTVKKDYIPIENISKDHLFDILTKSITKDLIDKNNLDSSKIGYSLFLIAKCGNKPANISIRFGTPEISGKDVIILDINDNYFADNYTELMPKFYSLAMALIPITKPLKVICFDYVLRKEINDNDLKYGYIIYESGQSLKDSAINRKIKVDNFENGYLWKADFSNHLNGIASVVETWE